jgi:hypothetical protein
MTVSAISTSTACQPLSPTNHQANQRGGAMKTLVDSINGGDLTRSKAAFDALQNNKPDASATSGIGDAAATPGTSQRDQDMAALGKALDSGDADAARQALARMQQDRKDAMQARGQTGNANRAGQAQGTPGHPHHGHHARASSTSATTAQDSALTYSASASTGQTSSPGSTVDVTA